MRRVALPNADFEAAFPADTRCPPKWACNVHSDASAYRLHLDFEVQLKAVAVEVGAALHGPGRLCLDDVRLEILPAAKDPV